ncbi:MAG: sigma-70 family RNA polymerase sigma factor [Clostridiaceae bacterium]|nr:sigma-70 family RNA polymerase sigma factor [Clostridiaceae bacterium]
MINLLYSKYYGEILGFCISLSRNQAFAEDIVQETYLRALANAHILNDLPEEKCRAWLYRTAKNIFIDHVRRMSKKCRPVNESVSEDGYSSVIVHMMCRHLPESERTLFILRYLKGYNSTELGDMFGIPPSTVRARLSSARSKLRKFYSEYK